MRRESDRQYGPRTGVGRRARDRILVGEVHPAQELQGETTVENHLLLLADDLRESALALSAIELFLDRAQKLVETPGRTPDEFAEVARDADVPHRIELLEDALGSLRRSLGVVEEALRARPAPGSGSEPCYRPSDGEST